MTGSIGFDVRAINYDLIIPTQDKIKEYVKAVTDTIGQIREASNAIEYVEGIKGTEQRQALESYIEVAVNKMDTIVKNLESFSLALDQVYKNYIEQGGNIASDLGAASSAVDSITANNTDTGVKGFGD